MEMNTRIQVEHPVTEEITGLDLVCEQIRVAAGSPLSMKQEDIVFYGHAIECRVNAEHPATFRPSPGRIAYYHPPGGVGVRVDSAVYQGYSIPPNYDSLIGKLIVHGRNRTEALMRLRRTLDAFIAAAATGRTIVVGNSKGGALGILEAAIVPERVHGLVLTSPALPRVGHALMHPSLALGLALYDVPALGDALTTARVRTVDAERLVRLGFRFTCARPAEIPEDVVELHVDAVREHQQMPGGVEAFGEATASLLRLARRPDVSARALGGVRCPVLLLHGQLDRLIPARRAEQVLRSYPTWRGRLFPGVGHVAMLEVPGRWLSEVAEWFAETYERRSGAPAPA
jgi:pimeloyl-ACP methyl ester carboxylesterase